MKIEEIYLRLKNQNIILPPPVKPTILTFHQNLYWPKPGKAVVCGYSDHRGDNPRILKDESGFFTDKS